MSFRLLTSHNALIFQMTSNYLGMDDAKCCKSEVFKVKDLYSLVMLDFSQVTSLDEEALKLLAETGTALIGQKPRIMVIANRNFTQIVDKKGYAEALPYYVGVAPVISEKEQKSLPELSAESLLKVVGPAVQESLRVYAKLDVLCEAPTVYTGENRPHVDLAGVGGFFSNNIKGNLLLCFKTESFLKTVSAIMKKEYPHIVPEISDWAAELVNSVFGKVKIDLKAMGYSFSSGIPAVFAGKDLEVFYSTKTACTINVMRCSGSFGEFFIELMMAGQD